MKHHLISFRKDKKRLNLSKKLKLFDIKEQNLNYKIFFNVAGVLKYKFCNLFDWLNSAY